MSYCDCGEEDCMCPSDNLSREFNEMLDDLEQGEQHVER